MKRVFYHNEAGMHVPPRPVGQGKGLPHPKPTAKSRPWHTPPHPMKITKTCGVQRDKIGFNPLKFGMNYKEGSNFVRQSVNLRTFLPRHAPPREFFPCPTPPRPAPQTFTPVPWPKSSAPCIPDSNGHQTSTGCNVVFQISTLFTK